MKLAVTTVFLIVFSLGYGQEKIGEFNPVEFQHSAILGFSNGVLLTRKQNQYKIYDVKGKISFGKIGSVGSLGIKEGCKHCDGEVKTVIFSPDFTYKIFLMTDGNMGFYLVKVDYQGKNLEGVQIPGTKRLKLKSYAEYFKSTGAIWFTKDGNIVIQRVAPSNQERIIYEVMDWKGETVDIEKKSTKVPELDQTKYYKVTDYPLPQITSRKEEMYKNLQLEVTNEDNLIATGDRNPDNHSEVIIRYHQLDEKGLKDLSEFKFGVDLSDCSNCKVSNVKVSSEMNYAVITILEKQAYKGTFRYLIYSLPEIEIKK
ncbi:MAG: hypothetical protein EP338_13915 [Bacteroidetes bacterium]|nr:MAG: hypothetical protein EP338_13915 [Bacteroidota bacterium]